MQQELFKISKEPEGFRYEPDFITPLEEASLLVHFKTLNFTNYQHGEYQAKRKIISYTATRGFPTFLEPFIVRAAKFANVPLASIQHALISEYMPGTPIGWHRDQPPYNMVIGISLGSAAPFRFRKEVGKKWERITINAFPRSIYIMSGPSRYVWQHSIPPVESLRYSITMRTIK